MLKAELKAETLKGIVNIASTLVKDVKVSANVDGLSLKAVDPAHVAMIKMDIPATAFESFEAIPCYIGLDLGKLREVVRLASRDDIIGIEADEGRITFRIGSITRRMGQIDTGKMRDMAFPKLHMGTHIITSADELLKGITAAGDISDHVTLTADPEGFEISCEGDTDSVSLRLEKGTATIDAEKEVRTMLPLDYFASIIKAIPKGTEVAMDMDQDYPIMICFAPGGVEVVCLIAPRIEGQ